MGKLKKGRRSQKGRLDPVARQAGPAKPDARDETVRQSKIVPLVRKLASAAPNDRSVALSAITVLAEDARMRRLLLKERLVATVMEQTLHDANEELVVESYGLLRNLTIEEGHEVAKHLWRSNIWASIESSLAKIEKSVLYMRSATTPVDTKTAHLLYDFIENVLSLVVSIASCSDDLYAAVYAKIDRVAALAVDTLNWNIAHLRTVKLFNALLDFVYEFASASAAFVLALDRMPAFSLASVLAAVQSPAHGTNVLGQVYAQGIYFHFLEVRGDAATTKDGACVQILQAAFGAIASIDIAAVRQSLAAPDNAQEPISSTKPAERPQDIDVPFGSEPPAKTQARADLQAIDISVDLFASICEFLASGDAAPPVPATLSAGLVDLLLNAAYPALLQLLQFDQAHAECLHVTAKVLAAFNNLCWLFLAADAMPTAWHARIPELWHAVEHVTSSDSLAHHGSALNVLWALTKASGPQATDRVSPGEVTCLVAKCNGVVGSLAAAPELDATRLEYVLACVGFLGSVAQVAGNTDTTGEISRLLLFLTEHFASAQNHRGEATAMEIPVECLNSLYDIFGDAAYEYDSPVFVQQNYLAKLESLVAPVKAFYKQIDRNKHAELKIRAEEAWTNLGRFIEYKRSERP